MSIIAGYLLPHAPVFISQVGGSQTAKVQETIDAFKSIAKEIKLLNPDLIIMISPHGPVFSDAIAIYDLETYRGDLRKFGEFNLEFAAKKDAAFIKCLTEKSDREKGFFYPLTDHQFKQFQHEPKLDHGIVVPYFFVSEELKDIPLVPMSYGTLSYIDLMRNGEMIQSVAEESAKRIVIIASGDMSHALKSDGPYDYHPDGPWFDEMMKCTIEKGTPYEIFKAPTERIENAAECGLRSYAIMMGALNFRELESKVFSYEGPFGVGYLLAGFKVLGPNDIDSVTSVEDDLFNALKNESDLAHPFVKIAKNIIEDYVNTQKNPTYKLERDSSTVNAKQIQHSVAEYQKLTEKHGVFVSIKKYGMLRGCIGTIVPTQKNTFEEIIKNAISACSRDYRFDPINREELSHLSISVDVLSDLEPVVDIDVLSPKVHGVIVHSKGQMGVLLPDLEGITTTSEQLKIASNKGGFSVDKIDQIECFTVERYR